DVCSSDLSSPLYVALDKIIFLIQTELEYSIRKKNRHLLTKTQKIRNRKILLIWSSLGIKLFCFFRSYTILSIYKFRHLTLQGYCDRWGISVCVCVCVCTCVCVYLCLCVCVCV